MKNERFTEVDFQTEYPTGRVAEHEVFMSFNNDCDAEKFQEWWNLEGSISFNQYLKREVKD